MSNDRRRVDSIVFDFDGVLVDTAADIALAANEALGYYGLPPASLEVVRGNIGGGAERLMQALLPAGDGVPLDQAVALFKAAYVRSPDALTTLYPGVGDMLERLRASGMRMAIATNKIEPVTHALLRALGVESYFLLVVGPESVTRRKPDPEAIELILGRLGMVAGRTVVIGDKDADIAAGKAAGTLTCGVLYGYGTPLEIEQADPDLVIGAIDELPAALGLEIAAATNTAPGREGDRASDA